MSNKIINKILFFVFCFLGIIWITPLLITVTNSFMTESEIIINYNTKPTFLHIANGTKENFVEMDLIPQKFSLNQYKQVLLYQPTYLVLLWNSVKITVPVVIGNLVVSLLTAYGFCIWGFRFKNLILSVYIVVMLMPLQAILVPNYIIVNMLHIKESYWAIILPGIFAPFGTFLLVQTMKSLSIESFEAAKVDNANALQIFLYIVLPQLKSGIAALVMLVFIEYWNVVDQAVIFIRDYYRQPLSIYLSRISTGRVGLVFAASCVYMFLPLWFLILGQKDLEKGIELGSVK